ncbi:uncharacterized protein AMSG_10097 [Thecamonas trahens ATCC 50062]|uniref:Uncharacterized protein n=1 Tax=Thecamonas trahens ATCC 50062 TaxID=461836 RepID=A0A0L0DSE3_THETB|nr:hypothetical protein AMSG_10097 [Thecamonas trahens ATCC 50062]KNC54378.1 hypothetical protein AMSG_10097 [Thecamonas trahens ATCC 50062]|eukprot:XP_013753678.1 hypothetical protein AMSG_10097 [Thecamonas trahens ATCC 50062]
MSAAAALMGVLASLVAAAFLAGCLAAPVQHVVTKNSSGGETITNYRWEKVVTKGSSSSVTRKYNKDADKAVIKVMSAGLSFAVFSFVGAVVSIVATLIYGVGMAKVPVGGALMKIIIVIAGLATVICGLVSVMTIGFSLPDAHKEDCERRLLSSCDSEFYKKFHGEENNSKWRGGDGYILGCVAMPFALLIVAFPFMYDP